MTKDELFKLRQICADASDYFEMCPLNWRVQEIGPYSYGKYEETKKANMEFSKTFGPRIVKEIIDDLLSERLKESK